jgi:hypothetical protein
VAGVVGVPPATGVPGTVGVVGAVVTLVPGVARTVVVDSGGCVGHG